MRSPTVAPVHTGMQRSRRDLCISFLQMTGNAVESFGKERGEPFLGGFGRLGARETDRVEAEPERMGADRGGGIGGGALRRTAHRWDSCMFRDIRRGEGL